MANHDKELTKAAEEALREDDAAAHQKPDPVPPAEQGGHSRSHAAHLGDEAQPNVHGADRSHEQRQPGAVREPPAVAERSGKQHR